MDATAQMSFTAGIFAMVGVFIGIPLTLFLLGLIAGLLSRFHFNPFVWTDCTGRRYMMSRFNSVHWRFGGNLGWQPVKPLIGRLWVNAGTEFFDHPVNFTKITVDGRSRDFAAFEKQEAAE